MTLRPTASWLLAGALALLPACGDDGTGPDAAIDASAPGSALEDSASGDASLPDAARPDYCVETTGEALQDITTTPASPYFIHHPAEPGTPLHTVIFLPGGPGARDLAMITWDLWLSAPLRADDMRIVVPYSAAGDFPSEAERAIDVLDEVLACHGGDPAHVHLGGTSLGGVAAFDLMLGHSDRFATLLGAPGLFGSSGIDTQVAALEGKSVFLGVGERDTDPWSSQVPALHDALSARGIDSRLVVFAGQGHILDASFDETAFFDFWAAH